jgi:hypothetical protein
MIPFVALADVVKVLARGAPRWGLLALALGFGGALMGTALRARRDARAAEQVMARAQGEGLLQRMRGNWARAGPPIPPIWRPSSNPMRSWGCATWPSATMAGSSPRRARPSCRA